MFARGTPAVRGRDGTRATPAPSAGQNRQFTLGARWHVRCMYAPRILPLMGTDRDRIDVHLPLRPVEFHILLSLTAGERHGYGIIQDIEARGETSVPDVGTMYRALARMVDSGLIEAAPAADADDERRNNYRITARGLRVAKAEARRLDTLMRAARLGGLLDKKAMS